MRRRNTPALAKLGTMSVRFNKPCAETSTLRAWRYVHAADELSSKRRTTHTHSGKCKGSTVLLIRTPLYFIPAAALALAA